MEHAMPYKTGGLVLLHHNDVPTEWHKLCARALTPSAVSDKSLIHNTGRDGGPRKGATTRVAPKLRGDIATHGFWKQGATTIFDIRVTDTDAPTYVSSDPKKILMVGHEKRKKMKYKDLCLARHRHFTPLVFSVNGLQGVETKAACSQLSHHLAVNWKWDYSEVCDFVRSHL